MLVVVLVAVALAAIGLAGGLGGLIPPTIPAPSTTPTPEPTTASLQQSTTPSLRSSTPPTSMPFLGPDACTLLSSAELAAAIGHPVGPGFTDLSDYRHTTCGWGPAPDSSGPIDADLTLEPFDAARWAALVGSANVAKSQVYLPDVSSDAGGSTYLRSQTVIAWPVTPQLTAATAPNVHARLDPLIAARLGSLPAFPPPTDTPTDSPPPSS